MIIRAKSYILTKKKKQFTKHTGEMYSRSPTQKTYSSTKRPKKGHRRTSSAG